MALEFVVKIGDNKEKIFYNFDAAVGHAAVVSNSRGGEQVQVDVVAHSEDDAREFMGEYGEKEYEEDPDASVFRRLYITMTDIGRVP